ncbi:hypothetical protein QE152_g23474 [Popillia japonica]|uniref:Uncharacterized protein n=1 Tax=Popillia japonica TaxID=7064 RepID=A0AAW1KH29_POPJA
MSITRQDLFTILRSSGYDDIEDQFKFLKGEIKKRTQRPESNVNDLNKALNFFKSQFRSRWPKAHRMQEKFLKDNRDWLGASILFPRSQKRRGRPETSLVLSAERTKRREDALAMLVDAKLSRYQYEVIRKKAPEKFPSYRYQYEVIRKKAPEKFPSYKVLQDAKLECYPKTDCIKVTSTSAEVSLQALLDHTMNRHPKTDCIKVTSTSAEVSLQALLDHTMNRLISVQHRVVNELNNAELDKLYYEPTYFRTASCSKRT